MPITKKGKPNYSVCYWPTSFSLFLGSWWLTLSFCAASSLYLLINEKWAKAKGATHHTLKSSLQLNYSSDSLFLILLPSFPFYNSSSFLLPFSFFFSLSFSFLSVSVSASQPQKAHRMGAVVDYYPPHDGELAVLSLNSLPLGFRFRPSDEELVDYYLRQKINGNGDEVWVIREIDVCKWEPCDLPGITILSIFCFFPYFTWFHTIIGKVQVFALLIFSQTLRFPISEFYMKDHTLRLFSLV